MMFKTFFGVQPLFCVVSLPERRNVIFKRAATIKQFHMSILYEAKNHTSSCFTFVSNKANFLLKLDPQ